ncbi:MAG: septal ring lytic transglycosylase RlpA family protein [Nitrosomonas sp.]|nr:MAG: septal ring lytic transglycosylase RlpA family protein [Nitrosomonas sp.]
MYQTVCRFFVGMLLLIAGLISGCATIFSGAPEFRDYRNSNAVAPYNKPYRIGGVTYYPMRSASGYREVGHASWYGYESGNRTAMGTRFLPHGLTAAHRTLPLPSRVRVTNLQNGRQVDVLVNDRGPFKHGRIIDLSQGAAKKIGIRGIGKVRVEYLDDRVGRK